jgi:hypothetical protein
MIGGISKKEYYRLWRLSNKDKIKSYKSKHYIKNKEKINLKCKKYNEENKDKVKLIKHRHYLKCKTKDGYMKDSYERCRIWRLNNKERVKKYFFDSYYKKKIQNETDEFAKVYYETRLEQGYKTRKKRISKPKLINNFKEKVYNPKLKPIEEEELSTDPIPKIIHNVGSFVNKPIVLSF